MENSGQDEDHATGSTSFPIVGIGASAGGLKAFEAFFSGMPAGKEPGMAFVLVQHLAPDNRSMLSELIRRCTSMPVHEVEDGMRVSPGCVYIIPPNRDMAFLNGNLQLLEPGAPRGQRLPIDFFFRSLADDQHERAIGIVLSGTGSDGTLGVRAIKGEGGMVMAQSPESAEFDGMPRSAIATGLVDLVSVPERMPAQLLAYAARAFGKSLRPAAAYAQKQESALKKIFVLLRAQTGHDFSQYKPSTIERRIERRMAVHQIEDLDHYVKFLQRGPAEGEALFRDLLIGVTSFFRDPEAFAELERVAIPKIFEGKPPGALIRVWTSGCSTGEEAYSIAILLQEHMEKLKQNYQVQVFATDIDVRAIAAARSGLYPASIAVDVSAERLARFFSFEGEGGGVRIRKNIRDMLIFSEHDLLKDPPFSKMDLITCRNLLIYLGAELQKRIIPLFHYALNPGGILFLGTSEGIGEFGELFSVLDRKAKLFRRCPDAHGRHRVALGRFVPSAMAPAPLARAAGDKPASPVKAPLREMTEQALLQHLAPAAALVNGKGDILYLHGRTGMFLEPAPGESGVNNILKMAREGLRMDLITALHKAVGGKSAAHSAGLKVKANSHFTRVDITVRPVLESLGAPLESPLYLVVFEARADREPTEAVNAPAAPGAAAQAGEAELQALLESLRQELRAKDQYLQSTLEELESSNEELTSSNEEMQSINEELQSTNEELETSKEELQSVNEELATVNVELHTKVQDLSRANNDMNNLLAGTGIGTVFVDHDLHILRFTPTVTQVINLIPGDIGRPVAHIASNLVGYGNLVTDIQAVLKTLVPTEVDVRNTSGQWFTMRIQPYRTLENVIEGAVMSFVNVTERRRMEDELRKAKDMERLAAVARDSRDAVTIQDLDGRILAWNPGAERLYGWTEAEAKKMNARDRVPEALRESALSKIRQLSSSKVLEPYFTQRLSKDGSILDVSIISTALLDGEGDMYAVSTTERHGD